MRGRIYDIQTYALYDGPGIRTCVYFQGCPLACWWCQNPESQSPAPRMAHWRDRCAACGRCVSACPEGALRLDGGGPLRNPERCVACGVCARACPEGAMERVGEEVTARDLARRLGRDRAFFTRSGGGVTATGGEPTQQPEFLLELAGELRATGIGTALETCGCFPSHWLKRLAEGVDLFLFDLKHIDPERHRQGTGVENRIILDNFAALIERAGSRRVIARLPLVAGFNTSPADVDGLLGFLREVGYGGPVHLMPCHGWARGKWERIGRGGEFRDPGRLDDGDRDRILAACRKAGFAAVWGG